MSEYVFDLETDGLLHELTKIHCLVLMDRETKEIIRCAPGHRTIEEGLALLIKAERVYAHNGIGFDLPAIDKVKPGFGLKFDRRKLVDTLVRARLKYPDVKNHDYMHKWPLPPGKLYGKHSLEAWGHRVGLLKGDFKERTDWKTYTPEMLEYCVRDVEVDDKLVDFLGEPDSAQADELEHEVAWIIARQERYGFAFDQKGAINLYAKLVKEKDRLTAECMKAFAPWYVPRGEFTPKKDDPYRLEKPGKRAHGKGYGAGASFTKVELVEFNPASREQIADRLKSLRGWEPEKFTPSGQPTVDDAVLKELPWPEAKVLAAYFVVQKLVGYIAEGDKAWLKLERKGRLHGAVNSNGAVTGRMSHFNPNLGQIPANDAPYGKECRALFRASLGKVLVGTDADALELRCLAGYMARYDGGTYIDVVLKGKKEDGTDMHSRNSKALTFVLRFKSGKTVSVNCTRDAAKTWFYAFIYGAGDHKLGLILGYSGKLATQVGKASRDRLLASVPALKALVEAVRKRASERGYLIGLDGRRLNVRSEHSALNTLLQAAGAILMKKALVLLDTSLQFIGFVPGVDYEFVVNVHDEWQKDCLTSIVEEVKRLAVQAIRDAGQFFDFRCPLDGQAKAGLTWAETH